MDFPKKSNVLVQKRNCENSSHSILCETEELLVTDCSVCESRTAELRDIVYSLCGSETAELFCAEAELRDLNSKLWYGSETAKPQVVLNLLYGSRTA